MPFAVAVNVTLKLTTAKSFNKPTLKPYVLVLYKSKVNFSNYLSLEMSINFVHFAFDLVEGSVYIYIKDSTDVTNGRIPSRNYSARQRFFSFLKTYFMFFVAKKIAGSVRGFSSA